mgnify:CR=1 FL=1
MSIVVPLGHERRNIHWPWLTLAIILASTAIAVICAAGGDTGRAELISRWGMSPARLDALWARPWPEWFGADGMTMVTTQFVHAGWLHLLGNMAYLWVFGMPVERRYGAGLLLLLFVVLGGAANMAAAYDAPNAATPVIGASGGVSAIIGAYLLLLTGQRIGLYLPLGFYLQFVRVPALLVIGSWFLLQMIYTVYGPLSGAVAWRVHITGFAGGMLLAIALLVLRWPRR